jgi:hypothetical protein
VPTYPIAQPADNAAAYTYTQPIRDSIIGVNDHQTRITALESSSPASTGMLLLNSVSGATDDLKLTSALSTTAAETYPRTIMLDAQSYAFTSGNRVAFDGMRIQGPSGFGNPERLSSTKMPSRIVLSCNGPWFINPLNTDVFSCSFQQLSIDGSGTNAVFLGQNGTGAWWCTLIRDMYVQELRNIFGTAANRIAFDGVIFDGAWNIGNMYGPSFHMGGSDNIFWPDGILMDTAAAYITAGGWAGEYHFWLDFMEKSTFGPGYITCRGGAHGIRVSGPSQGTTGSQAGPISFYGMRLEGMNAATPCDGALFRQEGGIAVIRDCWTSYAMANPTANPHSPVDAGVIHHADGQLVIDGCTTDYASSVSKTTVPYVYTNTPSTVVVRSIMRASKGGSWGSNKPIVARGAGATPDNRITDGTVTAT